MDNMFAALQNGPERDLEIEEIKIPKVEKGEVLVKMFASPINPSDLAYLTGNYTEVPLYPTTPGIEGSGTVVAVSGGILAKRLMGKTVMCSASNKGGTWAQYMVTKATKCIPLGKGISLQEGATMLVNPLTALVIAEISKKGKHKAIINTGAASSLGKMLIRLCATRNIDLVNVVYKREQKEHLESLGAKFVLNSSEENFQNELSELCQKLNVSLAFDAVSGDMTGSLLQSIMPGGEVKIYGGLSGEAPTFNPRELILNDKIISGLNLSSYVGKGGLLKAISLTGKVKKMVKNELKTTIAAKYGIDKVNEAINDYKQHMSGGKVLLLLER